MLTRFLKRFANQRCHLSSCKKNRPLQVERLLSRYPLTAEGQAFSFNQSIDTSAIGGAIAGTVLWGDGTSSPASVSASPSPGPLSIRFDYSLDSSGFFASSERRNSLQFAADSIVRKFSDQLTAIQPTGTSQWTAKFLNPATGAEDTRANLVIPANEILIFAGARGLNAGEYGRGEKGGFTASSTSQAFIDTVKARGQTGALLSSPTDFGPWGGTVAFSSTAKWHFGLTTDGLDPDEFDFVSVASHELMHSLGFGLANSWIEKVSGGFTGANSVAISGKSPVPLNDLSHWAIGTTNNGELALMNPDTLNGRRRLPTRLDYAGMQDIGWQFIPQVVQANASHIYGDNGSFAASLQLTGSVLGTLSTRITADITNVPPSLAPQQNQNAIEGQALTLSRVGVFTDPGFGVNLATPPRSETFTYSINWGDASSLDTGNATIEALGSAGVDTRGSFSGTHTYVQMGNFTVTMVVTDDDGGTSQQQFTVVVGPPPSLELSIDRNSIAEDAGSNAAVVTVRRVGFDTSLALTVALASNDTSELRLPGSVIIPVGQTTATASAQAIDDALLDGTVQVVLSASVGSIVSNNVTVDVLDREKILVSLNRTTFAENAGSGAATLTVARSNTDVGASITVLLLSNDTSEVNLPPSVVIPAGSASINVGVDAVDDALFDGSQIVILTATSAGYEAGTVSLTVTDYQPLSLVLQSNEINEEDPALRTTQAEVSIRSPAPAGGLTLQITASEPNQLTIPATVVIPAGSLSAPFPVSAVDDFAPQGRRSVRITASGNGVIATAVDIVITDNDPAYWTNPINPFDVNNNGDVDPLDVLIIINEINRNGTRALNPNFDLALPFVDPNRNGSIDPLDVLVVINEINR